ncbi:hypothetical protein ACFX13_044179 [Malus domestica]
MKERQPFYICHAKDGSGTPEHLNPCPKIFARRVLPDETCPTTPRNEAEPRQQPSTGVNLQGSCVLVGQETSPAEIPATNIVLARPVGSLIRR